MPALRSGKAHAQLLRQRRHLQRGGPQAQSLLEKPPRRHPPTCGARPATTSCIATPIASERWNMLHPGEKPNACAVRDAVSGRLRPGVVVAASDYLKSQPDLISRWIGRPGGPRSAPTASAAARIVPSLRIIFEIRRSGMWLCGDAVRRSPASGTD